MTIILKYGETNVSDFDALLEHYPPNQFNSLRRSTVPLLAYWKGEERCLDFLRQLDIQFPGELTLSFEYEVPVQAGKGAPSCTDLMILGDNVVVAIEAKYTEPDYETVRQWLRKAQADTRRAVLQGWLALINQATGSQLGYSDVLDIAYQAVHRTASACFPMAGEAGVSRFMVYQVFSDSEERAIKIVRDLAILRKMIPPDNLRFACMEVRLERKPAFLALEERWIKGKERFLRDDVREGLRGDSFFGFSSCAGQTHLNSFERPRA